MAEIQFRQKKYNSVEETVTDLRTRSKDSPFLYQADEVLGRAYKQQTPARFEDAIKAFERVVNDPNGTRTETSAKAQFLIGETLFLQNKWEPAFLAYQKVVHNYDFPDWQAASLLQSGKCSEHLKQWDDAEKSYQSLIETYSQSTFVSEAKQRLEFVQKNSKKS